MVDANPIYHPSLIILLLINTFFLLFHILFFMSMLISYIFSVLLFITQLIIIIYLFSHQLFFSPWMVDANFIFILVLISSFFCSVWHPFVCFILRIVYFIIFCVSSCSSHTVNSFSFSSKFLLKEFDSHARSSSSIPHKIIQITKKHA